MGTAAEFSTKCGVLRASSIYHINSVLFHWVFAHNTEWNRNKRWDIKRAALSVEHGIKTSPCKPWKKYKSHLKIIYVNFKENHWKVWPKEKLALIFLWLFLALLVWLGGIWNVSSGLSWLQWGTLSIWEESNSLLGFSWNNVLNFQTRLSSSTVLTACSTCSPWS